MTDTPILRALSAAVGATDSATDSELLRRFAEAGDRSAFELVVRRHAELVWGVCRAALPRDRHAAEDAFQAAFLILARKAATVREPSAAGWLFRVARNVAMRVRKHAARQSTAPLPDALADPRTSAEDTAMLREVAPAVAEEIARLAAKFREPVVLCVFEGHTHAEAAERLGWPIGTVASRLARAKDVLRDRLTRRGVVLPAAGLVAVFSPHVSAAPASLIRSTFATAIGPTERVSPVVLSLTQGVLSAMRFAKLQTAAALVAVTLGLTAAFAAVSDEVRLVPDPTNPTMLVLTPVINAARPADDKAAKEAEAKELKALQGKWRVVKQNVFGQDIPVEVFAGMRIVIEKDIWTVEDKMPPRQMQIKLAPGKSPKELDWTVLDGSDKGEGRQCIYKLDGDMLTICITEPGGNGEGRPKEFKSGKGLALLELERVKDEKEELAALAGEWKAVRVNFSGKELPAEEVEKEKGKWVIKGAELTMAEEGVPDQKAELKLDPAAAPPTFDFTLTDGPALEKGNVLKGIYFRQGDKLTIAFRDPKSKKDDRPTELKPGDEAVFVVFERKK